MKLIKAAKEYRRTPQQIKALNWFDASTGDAKQEQFAALWRNRNPGSNQSIDFAEAFKWYAGQPHQDQALEWLEQNSIAKTLEYFLRLYQQPAPATVRLGIHWDSQINSRYPAQAERMCFSSSVWMAMSFVSPVFKQKFPVDDDYLKAVLKYGDTTQAFAHQAALANSGFNCQYTQTANLQSLIDSLAQDLPVAIGILHRGSVNYPTGGGHWVCVGGVRSNGAEFQLYDPYGSVMDSPPYSGPVERGKGYWVPSYVLDSRWTVDGSSDGWAMFFRHNLR